MQKLLAVLTLATFLSPLAAAASTVSDYERQIMYLLGQVAVLKAEQTGAPVACAVIVTKQVVRVGEEYALIWNTFGAKAPSNEGPSQYAQGDVVHAVLDRSGLFTYEMDFYSPGGATTTCTASVFVAIE